MEWRVRVGVHAGNYSLSWEELFFLNDIIGLKQVDHHYCY